MYKNTNFGSSGSGYNIKTLSTGLKRAELAASFFLTMPGPKMIWQFGELGYDYSINACTDGTVNNNCRLDTKPIRWDYQQDNARKELLSVYTGLLSFRNHPSFKAGFTTNRVERSLSAAFKWLKLTTDTSNILVVGNFDVISSTGSVTFQSPGTWYDYFTGTTFTATGTAQSMTLQPGEFHIYVNRNVTYPINFSNPTTPVMDLLYDGKKLVLSVKPNPVKENGIIEYELPETGVVEFQMYNSNGQLLAFESMGLKPKGKHQLPISRLHKVNQYFRGTCFLQMKFKGKSIVQTLLFEN
jgi:hypothetical protein